MITEKELQISNMSYTEKDFQSIYPALLTLAKQLTNRWDPASSNESDPGNVLLKLAAVVGDKTNYNIDKNVLECFLPSATQETSMRMLTEALGYDMKYYQSAVANVLFKYTGNLDGGVITLPKFSTVISNDDNTVYYTLIKDVKIALSNFSVEGTAIEGSLNSLLVGNNEIIKMENLDDNNRLYFPEIMVAQNGVFITNNGQVNFDEWQLVDNLNVQVPLTKCYKFGFDSVRGLPYIEFPSDMAELIESGILVSYIVTKGVNGNVTAGTLTNLTGYDADHGNLPTGMSTDTFTENLVVYNASASTSGADKETINEAYSNFKKIIGTFDTLITTRDYANALYNLADAYGNPMISNGAVADRTNDFNHALNVVSYDSVGQYTDFIPSDDMSVADLTLYPLKPYQGQNYNPYNPSYVYNESFKPLKFKVTNTTTSDPTSETSTIYTDSEEITTDLDDMKCIGHSFRDIKGDEVCLFKTVAALDVQIFTYAKVNVIEQAEIRNNVVKALSDNFNARKLEYGYEIPYDTILDVIYSADSRIKSVSLAEPQYEVQYVTPEEPDGVPINYTDVMTKVIAENVLAGKLQLFRYDDRFEWAFGQTDIQTYDGVQSLTTNLKVYLTENSYVGADDGGGLNNYVVGKNEALQFIAPSIATKVIYPAGVFYQFNPTVSSDITERFSIEAGINYKLGLNETFEVKYVNSSGENINTSYGEGTIIRPSFELTPTGTGDDAWVKITKDNQIEIRDTVSVELNQSGTPIYWVRNNANNTLFEEGQTDVLLDTGEYFIYSNPTIDDLVILGAGTNIIRGGQNVDLSKWFIDNPLSLENINLNGLSAFTTGDWQFKQLTANNYITVRQMQVATFGEGTTVSIDGQVVDVDGASIQTATYIDGDFRGVGAGSTIEYTYGGETNTLENIVDGGWFVRTRLDVVCGPDTPQTLYSFVEGKTAGTDKKEQSITLELTSTPGLASTTVEIDGTPTGKDILFNYAVDVAGGKDISMLVTNLLTGVSSYSACLATYTKKDVYEQDITPIYHEYVPGTLETKDPQETINVSLDAAKEVVLPINIERFETEEPSQEEIEESGLSDNLDYKPYATYIIPLLVSLDNNATSPTEITIESKPEGALKFYKYNSSTYTLLTSGVAPADWSTNWTSYFTHDDLYGYEPVDSEVSGNLYVAPAYEANKYYRYDGEEELDSINASGLYNLEVVAGWLGEYPYYDTDDASVSDEDKLIEARPAYTSVVLAAQPSDWPTGYYTKEGNVYTPVPSGTTFSAGTYYVALNSVGDICKVLYSVEGGEPAGLYQWSGTEWELIPNSSPSDYEIHLTVDPGENVTVAETLNIGMIHKINGLNLAISSADNEENVLSAIDDLTKNAVNSDGASVTFHYTYTPDNSMVIETDNMALAEAFWDVNNVVNKFTISQLNLEDSNISIARSSQL